MITVLKFVYGDKRNPSKTVDLNRASKKIAMRNSGFYPGPGEQHVIWSGGSTLRDGQRRIGSSRDNAAISLTYQLDGTTIDELSWLQGQISRVALDVKRYEEDRAGDPIWLMYGLETDLDDLPAPAFGQMYHYLRVRDINLMSWPDNLHSGLLQSSQAILGVVANLTCDPYAEGLEQRAGAADGQLELGRYGVLMPYAATNQFTNPAFGHGTWNNGWSVSNADLKTYQETRGGFTRYLDSAAHLVNLSTSDQTFTQSLSMSVDYYYISCYARRADGEAVTSSDLQIWIEGAARTTTFVVVDGGPWYFCYATDLASAGSNTHGVQVKAGREVFVDAFMADTGGNVAPPPYAGGHLLGAIWASTAHGSSSQRSNAVLSWTMANELMGEYSVGGWLTTHWTDNGPGTDLCVWEYYVDGNNYVRVFFDAGADRFEVVGERDGTAFSGNGATQTLDIFEHVHVMTVQAVTTLKVYVNGEEDISVDLAVGMPADGTLALGCSSQSDMAITGWIDGWRIWREALTATQVDTIYDNETPVKDAYGSLGTPPFFWTKDGDNVLDAVDGVISSSAKDNWGVLAGVVGDVPASVEWQIDPPTSSPPRVFWLGRKSADDTFLPGSTLWLEYSGTADSGNSSGDAYETDTTSGSGTDTHDYDTALDEVKHVRGRFQALGRFYVTGAEIDTQPYFQLGSSTRVLGDVATFGTSSSTLFRDFGEILVDWPQMVTPPSLTAGIFCTETEATATTTRLDFLQLMPFPHCRVECEDDSISLASGDTLIISGREAWINDASDSDSQLYRFEFRGDEVTVEPGKYNYIFWLMAEEGQTMTLTHTATFAAEITPRWLLPGGPVA